MSGAAAVVRNELRILRHDPAPAAVLVAMPIVLMTLLSDAIGVLVDAPGSTQTVPGMACVFATFGIAIVGFAVFREHGWRTWPRLRAAGLSRRSLFVGKLAVPAGLLAGQHVVLFAFGVVFLDLRVSSWTGVACVAFAFSVIVLAAGFAAAAALSTVQQVNAVTNVGAMLLGGLGGAFVPVVWLPAWVEPIAPVSPVYWAMEGYGSAISGGGTVIGPVAALLAFAGVFATFALTRPDRPKRTWG